MKVLVISHTYISRVGREKWRELVRNFDVELKIIVPTVWKDYLFTIKYSDQQEDELDITPIPVLFSGKEAAHVYRSVSLLLSSFKPDILHVEEGTDAFSYFQALLCKKFYSPKSKTIFFTWMNFEKILGFPFSFFERFNLQHSDAAICGNGDARDILRQKGFDKPIYVMPLLGLDTTLFRKQDQFELKKKLDLDGVVIGFIGRFVEEKGVLDLIDVASTLEKKFTLLYIGGGKLEDAIRKKAAEKGIGGRVRIVLSVPHTEIPQYLNTMDILVLPSYSVPHWKEQFGQVLVQAMSCEVPVLGSTHAEIPRVIGDAGFTFQERNLDDFREKLRMLIDSIEIRAEYGEKGRRRIMDNYTNIKIAEQTHHIYQELLA